MDDNTGGEADVDETVKMTVTAIDQEGQPIVGAEVEYLRNGPSASDGDINYVTYTDANGVATYNFKPTEPGTADISAVVRDGNDGTQLATLEDSVVVKGTNPDGGGRKNISVELKTPGANGGKDDKLNVKTRKLAEGATVKLFRQNKKTGATRRPAIATGFLNAHGRVHFTVNDRNGNKVTKYIVKVKRTKVTKSGWSNVKGVR